MDESFVPFEKKGYFVMVNGDDNRICVAMTSGTEQRSLV